MMLRRIFLSALAALAVAGCATAEPPAAAPDFYVIRHLEKGEGADPGLTEDGRRNADTLATILAGAPPRAIYASPTRRARETARPAAEKFGLTVQDYDPRDNAALMARVTAERGPVLIVGHSNTVPTIVEGLGGGSTGPIGENDYGILYTIFAGKPVVIRTRVDWRCDPLLGGTDEGARC